MVNVGSVSIKGTINQSDIERGFARMELGMDSVKGKAKSFTTDLSRMSAISIGLANNLIGVGLQGASAMIKMATGSPAATGAMVQMELDTLKLSHSLGRSLGPAIDAAASAYGAFVGFMVENEDNIRNTTELFVGLLGAVVDVADALWKGPDRSTITENAGIPNEYLDQVTAAQWVPGEGFSQGSTQIPAIDVGPLDIAQIVGAFSNLIAEQLNSTKTQIIEGN